MGNNFDRVGVAYDRLAKVVFGRAIDAAQSCFLDQVPISAKVLILGGGSGRVVTELLARRPEAIITYLEASQVMLDLTKKRLKDWPHAQVELILGTEQCLSTKHHQFDVVITQFVLDVYKPSNLEQAMILLDKSLKSSGQWIFADFCLSSAWYRRWWQWLLIKAMYLFFTITANIETRTVVDFVPYFEKLGWVLKKDRTFHAGMIRASVWRKS